MKIQTDLSGTLPENVRELSRPFLRKFLQMLWDSARKCPGTTPGRFRDQEVATKKPEDILEEDTEKTKSGNSCFLKFGASSRKA